MKDIEDEDGEVERNDAEQLGVAPDESVPRLQLVVSDAVARGSGVDLAQHQQKIDSGNSGENRLFKTISIFALRFQID